MKLKPIKRGVALGVCEIVDGVLSVLSLGQLRLNLSLTFLVWDTKRMIKRGRRVI